MNVKIGQKPIVYQLRFWFALVGVIPLVTMAIALDRVARNVIEAQISRRLQGIALNKAHTIDSSLRRARREVSVLGGSPEIVSIFRQASRRDPQAKDDLREVFEQTKARIDCSDLLLVSTEGRVVLSARTPEIVGVNVLRGEASRSGLGKAVSRAEMMLGTEISEFDQQPGFTENAVYIVSPALDQGRLVGYVAVPLENRWLFKLTSDTSGLGRTGEIILAVQEGSAARVIAPMRHDPQAAFSRVIFSENHKPTPINSALNGIPGGGITRDWRGESVIAVWRYLPAFRWGIVVKMDSDEAFVPIWAHRRWIAGILLSMLILLFVGVPKVAKVFSAPILRLASQVARVRQRDHSLTFVPSGPLEIHELGGAFNAMTSELQSYYELTEKRVAELSRMNALEEQLRQGEKMSAVGQLAAGVAHEINNPLGIILGFSQIVVKRIPEGDPLHGPLKSIEKEAIRCKNLVQDLLQFSRSARIGSFEEVSPNETIISCLSLIEARAKTKNIEIRKELDSEIPTVTGNKNQLQQVIINLANNAIDSMDGGGKLVFRTRRSVTVADHVEIEVEDSGSGISPEIQKRVFEPFFTTKDVGKGTGLGLSLVYEIVTKHTGTIALQSEVGKGTKFTILIPKSEGVQLK